MSPARISAQELYAAVATRLGLAWVAGQSGSERKVSQPERGKRASLVGYLNLIHANKVQVIGSAEMRYLHKLAARQRRATLLRIVRSRPLALIVTRNLEIADDLCVIAEQSGTPLWRSMRRGHDILTYLQYHLSRALAPRVTLHGVMLEVYSIGVLITGDSGMGKSELALELITRGHRLVADDAPEFTRIAPDVIDGTCPESIRDSLEVRGLGLLNIRDMFGDTAVKGNKYLRLIIHLAPPVSDAETAPLKRLTGDVSSRRVLDVDIPQLTIPVGPGRNLAVLVEAAVRNFSLKNKGIDAARTFIDRQAHHMRREQPWNPS